MKLNRSSKTWQKGLAVLLMTMLVLTSIPFGFVQAATVKANGTFLDVPLEHPYYIEITTLAQEGVIQGNTDHTFRPDEELKYEHAALLLERLLEDQEYTELVQLLNLEAKAQLSGDETRSLLLQAFGLDELELAASLEQEMTRGQFAYALYHLTHQQSELIPLEDFFRQSEKIGFAPSPNGEHLAFLQPWENRLNIHVQLKGQDEAIRITNETKQDILGFGWLSDTRLLYIFDTGGDENFRLYAVDIDGTNVKELTPYENTVSLPLDFLENDEDEILIQMNKRNPSIFDVYRLNIHTAELTLVAENPGFITGWMNDHQGKVRVAVSSDGINTTLLYRETEEDDFEPVLQTDVNETLDPILFSFDNPNQIYAATNIGRDKAAIVLLDITTGKIVETVFEHPEVDVMGIIPSFKKKKVLAASYVTDKVHFHYFDKEREQLHKKLESKLPGYEIRILSLSEDENTIMLLAGNDKSKGTYYYYDVQKDELTVLADLSPWLKEEDLADMKPIQYTSRDGLTIHGYLTLPKGQEAKNLPVVINPHGGPWARDVWGYNPEVQFLASRGYAVLQMNFRGSTGYGKEFLLAGNKQWGKAMQDDITDGVEWLIEQGIADSDRIAIYGASYGGYATLAGLTFTPDLYAAGVSYVGPSNLFTLLDSLPPYWESQRQMFYDRMGHPEEDKELLEAASPLFHVDQITAPLFIAQGANDPRVKQAESDQIVAALQERGVQVPYMLKENEGHGFRNEENVFDFYRALERFLATHLNMYSSQ